MQDVTKQQDAFEWKMETAGRSGDDGKLSNKYCFCFDVQNSSNWKLKNAHKIY